MFPIPYPHGGCKDDFDEAFNLSSSFTSGASNVLAPLIDTLIAHICSRILDMSFIITLCVEVLLSYAH